MNQPERFTASTAKSTGRSERTVQREAERGEKLGPTLNRIAGTSLDKGVEIDALAALPHQEREDLVARAEKGEEVSARKVDPSKNLVVIDTEGMKATTAARRVMREYLGLIFVFGRGVARSFRHGFLPLGLTTCVAGLRCRAEVAHGLLGALRRQGRAGVAGTRLAENLAQHTCRRRSISSASMRRASPFQIARTRRSPNPVTRETRASAAFTFSPSRIGPAISSTRFRASACAVLKGYRTHFYAGSALYGLTPCTREAALKANKPYEEPIRYALAGPRDADHDEGGPF